MQRSRARRAGRRSGIDPQGGKEEASADEVAELAAAAECGRAREVVEPLVERVAARTVGEPARDRGELVVGAGQRRMVACGLAGERGVDRRCEAGRLLALLLLVAVH